MANAVPNAFGAQLAFPGSAPNQNLVGDLNAEEERRSVEGSTIMMTPLVFRRVNHDPIPIFVFLSAN
jgi:hypothetical protein